MSDIMPKTLLIVIDISNIDNVDELPIDDIKNDILQHFINLKKLNFDTIDIINVDGYVNKNLLFQCNNVAYNKLLMCQFAIGVKLRKSENRPILLYDYEFLKNREPCDHDITWTTFRILKNKTLLKCGDEV